MNQSLDLDDVTLVPTLVSEIETRDEIDTSCSMAGRKYDIPLINAPMKDVCNQYVLELLSEEHGSYGIMHRFIPDSEKEILLKKLTTGIYWSIGVNEEHKNLSKYVKYRTLFCIDVANGASKNVESTIETILSMNKSSWFIVGNVASGETFKWCAELPNVVGVRVGIAGGTACTTKNATGIYHGMFSLIRECREIKDKKKIEAKIIADGGINSVDKFCKSLAAGADFSMVGSLLASCKDSPAKEVLINGEIYKEYSGSASFENQKTYKENPRYIEGTTRLLKRTDFISREINRLIEGLKSSMSYFNARNLEEYRNNVTFYKTK